MCVCFEIQLVECPCCVYVELRLGMILRTGDVSSYTCSQADGRELNSETQNRPASGCTLPAELLLDRGYPVRHECCVCPLKELVVVQRVSLRKTMY